MAAATFPSLFAGMTVEKVDVSVNAAPLSQAGRIGEPAADRFTPSAGGTDEKRLLTARRNAACLHQENTIQYTMMEVSGQLESLLYALN